MREKLSNNVANVV